MKKFTSLMLMLLSAVTTLWAQPKIVTSTAEDPVYYVIASYNRGGVLTNAGVGAGVTHVGISDAGYWYFEAAENGGYRFVNKLTTDAGEKIYLGSNRQASTEPAVWHIITNGVNTKGLTICSAATISGSNCLDASNSNTSVGGWAPNSGDWHGTTWIFQISDPKYNPNKLICRTRTEADDRYVSSINLASKYSDFNSANATAISHTYAGDKGLAYIDLTNTVTMKAEAGESVTPSITRSGHWTNAYVYIDKDGDGFTASINGTYEPAGDLVSYSFYAGVGKENTNDAGYNSEGTSISDNSRNTISMPAFIAPTEPGLYRMRFKHSWNSIDPNGGESTFGSNGGSIIDVMLEVVEVKQTTNVTYKFPEFEGKECSVTIPNVFYDLDASTLIPEVSFFNADGLEESDNVVSADNNTFTVNGTWEFPFSLNTNYRIKNHGAKNAAFTYFYYNAESNRIQTKNLTDADKMSNERVFYLKSDGGFNEAGNLKVTLHSAAAGDNLGFTTTTGNNNDGSFTETPTEFLVVTNSSHNGVGVSLRHPESATAHVNAYSGTSELGIWNNANAQNDSGSSLLFYSVEEDMSVIPSWIDNGNAFADLSVATEESQNAWHERIATLDGQSEYTYDDYNELLPLYNAMVESTSTTPGNVYITLGSFPVPTDLMCVRFDGLNPVVGRYGDDVNTNKTTWKVVAAEGGFKLYNVYSASYLDFPAVTNQNSTVVASEADGSVFVLTLHNPATAQYGVKCIDADAHASYKYLHTNTNHNIVHWVAGDNSSWYLAGVEEDVANSDAKEGVKDAQKAAEPIINLLGEKVCQYVPEEETNTLREALETAMDGEDCNAILDAAEALKANIATLEINKPESGKMYTLRGAVGGFYAVANSESGQLAMAENVDRNNAAVFTFEAVEGSADTFILTNHKYSSSIFSGTHTLVVPTDEAAVSEHFTFLPSEGGVLGTFTVKSNSTSSQYFVNYYDNAISPRVDRQTSYGNKCDWVLEEIQDPFNFTEIEEIEVAAPVIEGIYDLQGRKLSAPVKGINIINGKKVLVK